MTGVLRALVSGEEVSGVVSEDELAQVVDHRLHGLLDSRGRGGGVEMAPEQATQLRATLLVERTHRRRLLQTLRRAEEAVAATGVDVAIFKGLAVEKQWYGSELERPCSDLDLLLAPHHFSAADRLVGELQPDHPLIGSIARLFAEHRLQSVDVRVDGGTSIDLHADLLKVEVPMRQAADVWTATLPRLELEGAVWRTVPAEMALVQLLLHLNKDRFAYLLNVADVLRVVDMADLDWDSVKAIARREGLVSHVFGALRRVMDWSGRTMPTDVRRHGSPVWRALWPGDLVGQGGSGIRRRRRRQLLIPITARGRSLEAVGALWRRWVRIDPVVRATLDR